jgi:hypothetical protein
MALVACITSLQLFFLPLDPIPLLPPLPSLSYNALHRMQHCGLSMGSPPDIDGTGCTRCTSYRINTPPPLTVRVMGHRESQLVKVGVL